MRSLWFGSCLAAVGIWGISGAEGHASTPGLERILHLEATGEPVDRRASLSELEAADLSESARWQLGQLKQGGQWHCYEALSELQESPLSQQYREQREQLSPDAEGHRRLAIWCSSRQLDQQAKGHWHAVLTYLPDDAQARKALNHAWIEGSWFTPEERLQVADTASKLQAEWSRWIPRLSKIAADVSSDSPARTKKGLNALSRVDDPQAISSLEVVSQQLSNDHVAPFIKAIARHKSSAACLACCRIALDRLGEAAGDLALQELKAYPLEMYVPELLRLLREPTQSDVEYQYNSKGELLIRRVISSETMDEKQLIELQRLVRVEAPVGQLQDINATLVNSAGVKSLTASVSPIASSAAPSQIAADEVAAARNALESQTQIELQIEQANAELRQSSRKVYGLLAKTTGQVLEDSPNAWWSWWREANVRTESRKPLRNASYNQVDQPQLQLKYAQLGTFTTISCLVRGTLIQTERGLQPIESIKIGDLVMAQDVETGQLGLKPVLQTTIRPPKSTLKIVTAAGVIQATAGHRWFVSGKGWLMTKDLNPEMLLHNAKGTTEILELIEDPLEQETYNLVVDGFHTYFVGPERVLSYDNSELKPTLRAVPGYGSIAATK